MKVVIKNSGDAKALTIALPTAFLFNPASAAIVSKQTEEFTYEQMHSLMKALRKAKKCLRSIPIVEVKSSNGEEVTVWL